MPDSTQVSSPQLPGGVIVPPPPFKFVDYPAAWAVTFAVVGSIILLVVTARFDNTKGALTISLLIILAFIGVLINSVTVTVPRDETTAAVIGALTAAFGGVITFWLKNRGGGGNAPD
jgi:FtsH-binding integral membrane protein